MLSRELELPQRSFFLFGPRQTGKSTWISSLDLTNAWIVNFLHYEVWSRYVRDPGQFRRDAESRITRGTEWIVLDEVQRIPDVLNEVHSLSESNRVRFILSGSSARKLKRGGANMLGGRAVVRHMHPFTSRELGSEFDLEWTLLHGTLPAIYGMDARDTRETLLSYVETYLREEIQAEGLVRNIGGYTRFLDLAAAYAGEVLNASSLSREAGIAARTVQSYFEVLEDTLILIRLPAWRKSALKRLVAHPRLYLFDNGVTNALTHRLSRQLDPATRGKMFEQFLVQETQRRIDYSGADAQMFWWRTNNGAEVDLLVAVSERPRLAVEIKSRPTIAPADLSGLRAFHREWPEVPCVVACTSPEPYDLDFARVLPWRDYIDLVDRVIG